MCISRSKADQQEHKLSDQHAFLSSLLTLCEPSLAACGRA